MCTLNKSLIFEREKKNKIKWAIYRKTVGVWCEYRNKRRCRRIFPIPKRVDVDGRRTGEKFEKFGSDVLGVCGANFGRSAPVETAAAAAAAIK